MAICGVDGAGGKLKRVFEAQMQSEFFPVPLENIGVTFRFQHLDLTDYTHPGGAYGYRISERGKTLVYCTDTEHGDTIDPDVVPLSRNWDRPARL
ncbi:MAG TPA: hypothetical protein EYQ20_08745 [candidate division Zixibacteria bacterium]|nr:hypothetical protein [candidate division Zixibacteria bacterium]